MRKLLVAALIAAVAWPMPARAQDVLRLKPSTKWFLDYAEDSCRLARKFGEGDQQVTLFLDQFEPGDHFQMTLGGDVLQPKSQKRPVELSLRFGPNEAADDVIADTGTMDDKRALIVTGLQRIVPHTEAEKAAAAQAREQGLTPIDIPIGETREAAATSIELGKGLRRDLVLETGPMDKAMTALRNCSWDTVKLWGLDVDQQKTLTRRARWKNSPTDWISGDDYPSAMARQGYEAIVNFRILIDPTGKPTSCNIQTSTRPKEFDDAVCRAAMRRARFEPALDAAGKPVRSYWRGTVRFRLES